MIPIPSPPSCLPTLPFPVATSSNSKSSTASLQSEALITWICASLELKTCHCLENKAYLHYLPFYNRCEMWLHPYVILLEADSSAQTVAHPSDSLPPSMSPMLPGSEHRGNSEYNPSAMPFLLVAVLEVSVSCLYNNLASILICESKSSIHLSASHLENDST